MGDFIAKICNGSNSKLIGQFVLGVRNERGERLKDFVIEKQFATLNTIFKQLSRYYKPRLHHKKKNQKPDGLLIN